MLSRAAGGRDENPAPGPCNALAGNESAVKIKTTLMVRFWVRMAAPVIAKYGYQNALTVKFTGPGVTEPLEALHTSSVIMPVALIYASTAIPLYVFREACGVTIRVLFALVINGIVPVEVPQAPAVIIDVGPAMVVLPSDKPKLAFPPGSVIARVRAAAGVGTVIVKGGFVTGSPLDRTML